MLFRSRSRREGNKERVKYKQWYIAAALALLLLAVVCLYQRQTTSTVRSGYTQAGVCDEWNELIAAKTNQKEISLSVDGKRLAKNDIQPYMADDRQLMIPVDTLRDVFLCNVGIYDHKTLKAYRNDRSIEAEENKEEIVINGEQPDWNSLSWLQKRFMKWFNKERSAGRSSPPIPTTCCSRPITARSSCA